MIAVKSDTYLALRLRDAGSADVFSALAEVLVLRVAKAPTESEAVLELFGGLRQWQVFLAAAREGLTVESQRGLFGELMVLGRLLVPGLGPRRAVEGWKGFALANQDFQFPSGAIEVKTTAAVAPKTVRVSTERQLDETGVGELFLHVVIVDDREVASTGNVPGQTLAELVAETRRSVEGDAAVRATLDDGLVQAGWLDAAAAKYDGRRLTVRRQITFHVGPAFPRIIERTLPAGVANASYDLDLNACAPFECPAETMVAILGDREGGRS
jgi:hypothetical protein